MQAVLDGEIAVLNDEGIADFRCTAKLAERSDGELIYYVFDILWLNGYNLEGLPLLQRKEILKQQVEEEGIIRISENFETSATEFLSAASKLGMEGIMAKKADSIYTEGERTKDWLKIKANKRHEVVIGGYTQNEGSSKTFSSLLVGVYDDGKLNYMGKIGTGFNKKMQDELMNRMKKLVIQKAPFTEVPDVNKPSRFRPDPPRASVTWVKPQLVCEVSYIGLSDEGVMRHPSFEGLRTDKDAKEVKREIAVNWKKFRQQKSNPQQNMQNLLREKEEKLC
jgi:bifunctional non-homologous end joining protein LigD